MIITREFDRKEEGDNTTLSITLETDIEDPEEIQSAFSWASVAFRQFYLQGLTEAVNNKP